MNEDFLDALDGQLKTLRDSGLYKHERVIKSAQQSHVQVEQCGNLINLCADNYLGLANHSSLVSSAKQALDEYGFGMASSRSICGTQAIHKTLEKRLASFLGTEDTILYSSCSVANCGLFDSLLDASDAIVTDQCNNASITDGVRLCNAKHYQYAHHDMSDLRVKLGEAKEAGARYVMIVTDGVFFMDGSLANMPAICDLSDEFNAIVMMDDSHGIGVVGEIGRGTHESFGCIGRVDIISGTFGKALGGASGGYVSGRAEIIDTLRQRSGANLFSNALAPLITAASIRALDLVYKDTGLLEVLRENTQFFRTSMQKAGFDVMDGHHPIVPIMLGEAKVANEFAEQMLIHGVLVAAFSYPTVPEGAARIRVQLSAAHSRDDIAKAIDAFIEVRKSMGL